MELLPLTFLSLFIHFSLLSLPLMLVLSELKEKRSHRMRKSRAGIR